MTKRPNKLGRIEGEPKVKKKLPLKTIGSLLLGMGLIALGITGTLGYQNYVASLKADGVAEYRANKCQKYSNEDKSATWLECDLKRVENNR